MAECCTSFENRGLGKMHQVVGSHHSDGAGGDHQPLEHFRVQIFAFLATVIQTLNCITEQRLILNNNNNNKTVSL